MNVDFETRQVSLKSCMLQISKQTHQSAAALLSPLVARGILVIKQLIQPMNSLAALDLSHDELRMNSVTEKLMHPISSHDALLLIHSSVREDSVC